LDADLLLKKSDRLSQGARHLLMVDWRLVFRLDGLRVTEPGPAEQA
jgi:hypothetical protein